MDYDLTDIPASYDRGRRHSPEVLDLWMDVIERHVGSARVDRILDLGCGTGRFSGTLAVRFDAEVIGVDPSVKMLGIARKKVTGRKAGRSVRLQYQQGVAESIPLPSSSVDMIFVSMSFHHFRDRDAAARECKRVLSGTGKLFLRTGSREEISSYPYVPYFPSARRILEGIFQDRATLCAPFERSGFQLASAEVIIQEVASNWSAYADKLAAGGDSVLARLGADELATGLDQIRRLGRESDGPVTERIDLLVFSLA